MADEAEPDVAAEEPVPEVEESVKVAGDVPKKKKIIIDPNATVKDKVCKNYFTSMPALAPEGSYTPILYTFRVKIYKGSDKLKHISANPPPFWLQFDHCLATVYTIFNASANKQGLGIVQLQWALYFLESLYNTINQHPQDVQLCINAIREYLVDIYSDMSQESVMYGSSKLSDFEPEEVSSNFSWYYCNMIGRIPESFADEESRKADPKMLEQMENVQGVIGTESIDLAKVKSKDQMMYILNNWKKEQLEKIETEMKQLHIVEDMLKNSDNVNFAGYTSEKQVQEIFKRSQDETDQQ